MINKKTFDALKGRLKDKFPTLIEVYLRDAANYIEVIETQIKNEGDLSKIIESAHSLKSASGLLGLSDVHSAAEKLEYSGKDILEKEDKNLSSLAPHHDKLSQAFENIKSTLENEIT